MNVFDPSLETLLEDRLSEDTPPKLEPAGTTGWSNTERMPASLRDAAWPPKRFLLNENAPRPASAHWLEGLADP
jgi:hypothetical protein